MTTEVSISAEKFLINGRPTYAGVKWRGKSIEGLVFNSRMIQAVFDDECPRTRGLWAYPDTGKWDPDRNTDEFCAHLGQYRSYGLLGVTVGLQGGGSVYTPEVYDNYTNSAYADDGSLREPYFDRLSRILAAADDAGMVVIVNYFYGKQARRLTRDAAVEDITRRVSEWLLETGRRNILVDVVNESFEKWEPPVLKPGNVHRLIEIVTSTRSGGRRLLAGVSTGGGMHLGAPKWLAAEDFHLPHGNGLTAEGLAWKIRALKRRKTYLERPRPIVVNEDSVFTGNLEAAVGEGASWGFYCQGYGSDSSDRMDWKALPREDTCEHLSGFQTLPVNWSINTPLKRAFFEKVREITGGA